MAIQVSVAGATGWTGSLLARTIVASSEFQLVGAIARQRAGQDIGEALGLPKAGITIVHTLDDLLATPIDVLIDYSHPASVKDRTLKQGFSPLAICTHLKWDDRTRVYTCKTNDITNI